MGTLISTNIYSTQYFTLRDSRVSHSEMTNSMQRLSSGRKLNGPGDSPSDFGISAQYDFTVVNSKKSINNLLNAQNVLETSDTWLNNVQDMLRSMSELQVSSTDGSKNQGDRENLDLEYQQLKDEISRIGADTTFNGVQILGKDQFITYDDSANTFTLSQFDGGQAYQLPYKIADGLKSSNNKDFHFNENNSYTRGGI